MRQFDDATLRRIIAEEIRKALADFSVTPNMGTTESALGHERIAQCQSKEGQAMNEHTDPTSTATDGGLSSLEQTALDRWSRMRLKPKPAVRSKPRASQPVAARSTKR